MVSITLRLPDSNNDIYIFLFFMYSHRREHLSRSLLLDHKLWVKLCWKLDDKPPKVGFPNRLYLLGSSVQLLAFFVSDARHRPEGLSSDAAGVSHALSGSQTDKLTRDHRMTLDEAHLILNSKKDQPVEHIIKVMFLCVSFPMLLFNFNRIMNSYFP